jgi:hypothetical protein
VQARTPRTGTRAAGKELRVGSIRPRRFREYEKGANRSHFIQA